MKYIIIIIIIIMLVYYAMTNRNAVQIERLGVIPRAHAQYLVHPKLLFPVHVRTYIVVKNAILRARLLTTVKLLYLVRVRMCAL